MVLQRAHPEDRALVQTTLDRASRDGKDFDYEYRLLMPDGSIKHVHVVAHAVGDQADRLEFISAVMDVTEARRVEEQMHQARADLAHVARMTTLITATIAHEINQPLAALVTQGRACLRWVDPAAPTQATGPHGSRPMAQDFAKALPCLGRQCHRCIWAPIGCGPQRLPAGRQGSFTTSTQKADARRSYLRRIIFFYSIGVRCLGRTEGSDASPKRCYSAPRA